MARRSGFPQANRRRVGWEAGVGQVGVQTQLASSSSIIANQAVAALQDGLTLVRTRGRFQIFLQSASASGDGFSGAIGIGVATVAAVSAGVASVPTPITEQGWDGWLYWQAIQVHAAGVVAGSVSDDTDAMTGVVGTQVFDIDSKAMRKLRIDDSIYLAIEVVEIGTATALWFVDTRMLFKLP